MKTTTTYTDNRVNRDNNFGGFMELAHDIVLEKTGLDKNFSGGSMTYNNFTTTGYKKHGKDSQVDVVMDFKTNTITITVETYEKSKLDEEMEMWEAREKDEFGQTIREIDKKAFSEWFNEESEYGFATTPLSWHIAAYSLDGNRKHTAKVITNIIEEYDMMEDVQELVEKMNILAQ